MEELKTWNKLSPEQQKAAQKALDGARLRLVVSTVKFMVILFLMNLVSQFLGHVIMQDVDDSTWVWFCGASSVLCAIFAVKNLHSALEDNNTRLKAELTFITKS